MPPKNINMRVRKNDRESVYSCRFCSSESETKQDALPLALSGNEGKKIIKSLGLTGNEACCPHCRGLIVLVIGMIETK